MEFDAVDMRIEGAHLPIEGARQMDAREVSVRVDGLDAERTQEVQARVAARLERRWSIRSRAGAATQRQPGSPKQDVQVPIGPIEVSLLGTHSDRALREDIEGDIRDTVVSALPPDGDGDGNGGGGGGGGGGGPVCICMLEVPGRRIPLGGETLGVPPPRIPWRAEDGTFTPPPPPATTPYWVIFVKLDPWNYARLILENGALRDPPVGPDQILVGLANKLDWAKEI